jgi:hypothetical protein
VLAAARLFRVRRGWVTFNHANSLPPQARIMKVRQNLEAVFVIAAAFGTFAPEKAPLN